MHESGKRQPIDFVSSLLGDEFADAVAIAKANDALLVSDDLLLKELAANEWRVPGVATFDLLMHGSIHDATLVDAFERATVRMVRWRFVAIQIRPQTLGLALQASGHEINDDIKALLDILADPDVDGSSAVRVAAGALRELWLGTVALHQLQAVTEAILEALVRHRGTGILQELKSVVAVAMRLVPQYEHMLVRVIEGYRRDPGDGRIISVERR